MCDYKTFQVRSRVQLSGRVKPSMFEALDCIPSKERRKKGAKKKGFQATIKL
jgi:hypothetical protein